MAKLFRFPKDYKALPRKRVAVILPQARKSTRDCLDGILRYSNTTGHWNLLILPLENFRHDLKQLTDFAPEGIIALADVYPKFVRKGLDPQIPVLLLDPLGTSAPSPHPCISLNIRALTKALAQLIAGKNIEHVALVGMHAEHGLTLRRLQDSLTQDLLDLRPDLAPLDYFLERTNAFDEHTLDLKKARQFLLGLPKPCLILAQSDWLAWHLILLCHDLGLNVPGQVMVLGKDNDESLCLASDPQISSVAPDYNAAGYMAGKVLSRLLWTDGRSVHGRMFTFGLKDVIERDSTLDPRGASLVIQKAKDFIRRNFTEPITVEDVAHATRVSKRTLNLHFSKSTDKSVHEAILTARLKNLIRLLPRKDISIRAATEQSGFSSENRAKAIFRARFQMTMTEYRASPACRGAVENLLNNDYSALSTS